MNNCTARIAVTRDLVYIEDYEVDRADISGTTYGFPNNTFFDPNQPNQNQVFNQNRLSSEPVIIPVFAEGEDTGFTLDVSPSVGKDTRFITITLNPRIRELVDTRTFELVFPVTQAVPPVNGNGDDDDDDDQQFEQQTGTVERPVVGERSLSTKLTVADGSVVALGGLMQQREVQIRSKVPVLSDIPIIGDFFGRKTFGTQKTNLLIFVQCELITPTGARYADAGKIDEQAPPRGTPSVELRERQTAPAVRRDEQP
jgi:type II secretory pathway component GspD/PulD (secretin)